MIETCGKCEEMTEWYLKNNPDKKRFVLCESCFEKSKEFYVYLDLPYEPNMNQIVLSVIGCVRGVDEKNT